MNSYVDWRHVLNPAIPCSDIQGKYPADPKSVARFLKDTPGLGKVPVGEILSKGPADMYPFNAEVLREYVDTFDFSGAHFSEYV